MPVAWRRPSGRSTRSRHDAARAQPRRRPRGGPRAGRAVHRPAGRPGRDVEDPARPRGTRDLSVRRTRPEAPGVTFSATAARKRSFNAASLIVSPSWKSIARLTFPSRLELNRPAGSFNAAPLAKVTLT